MKYGSFIYFFNWNGKRFCVDATFSKRMCKYVNDGIGESQNCVMKQEVFDERPHLCLYAKKDLAVGDELRYDYGVSDLPWRKKKKAKLKGNLCEISDLVSTQERESKVKPEKSKTAICKMDERPIATSKKSPSTSRLSLLTSDDSSNSKGKYSKRLRHGREVSKKEVKKGRTRKLFQREAEEVVPKVRKCKAIAIRKRLWCNKTKSKNVSKKQQTVNNPEPVKTLDVGKQKDRENDQMSNAGTVDIFSKKKNTEEQLVRNTEDQSSERECSQEHIGIIEAETNIASSKELPIGPEKPQQEDTVLQKNMEENILIDGQSENSITKDQQILQQNTHVQGESSDLVSTQERESKVKPEKSKTAICKMDERPIATSKKSPSTSRLSLLTSDDSSNSKGKYSKRLRHGREVSKKEVKKGRKRKLFQREAEEVVPKVRKCKAIAIRKRLWCSKTKSKNVSKKQQTVNNPEPVKTLDVGKQKDRENDQMSNTGSVDIFSKKKNTEEQLVRNTEDQSSERECSQEHIGIIGVEKNNASSKELPIGPEKPQQENMEENILIDGQSENFITKDEQTLLQNTHLQAESSDLVSTQERESKVKPEKSKTAICKMDERPIATSKKSPSTSRLSLLTSDDSSNSKGKYSKQLRHGREVSKKEVKKGRKRKLFQKEAEEVVPKVRKCKAIAIRKRLWCSKTKSKNVSKKQQTVNNPEPVKTLDVGKQKDRENDQMSNTGSVDIFSKKKNTEEQLVRNTEDQSSERECSQEHIGIIGVEKNNASSKELPIGPEKPQQENMEENILIDGQSENSITKDEQTLLQNTHLQDTFKTPSCSVNIERLSLSLIEKLGYEAIPIDESSDLQVPNTDDDGEENGRFPRNHHVNHLSKECEESVGIDLPEEDLQEKDLLDKGLPEHETTEIASLTIYQSDAESLVTSDNLQPQQDNESLVESTQRQQNQAGPSRTQNQNTKDKNTKSKSDDESLVKSTQRQQNQAGPSRTQNQNTKDKNTKSKSGKQDGMKMLKPHRPCLYCGIKQSKLTRHLKTKHSDEERIKAILDLPIPLQHNAFDQIKKEGILKANKDIMKNATLSKEELKKNLIRERRQGEEVCDLSLCSLCNGFFAAKTIHKHKQNCMEAESTTKEPVSIPMALIADTGDISYRNDVLAKFRHDDVGNLCRTDDFIKLLGFQVYVKIKSRQEKKDELRDSIMSDMRRFAHLFLEFKSLAVKGKQRITSSVDMLCRDHFNFLREAISNVTTREDGSTKSGLKTGIGFLLKRAAKILKGEYLIQKKDDKATEVDNFVTVLQYFWSAVFSDAQYANVKARQTDLRKPKHLPNDDDVVTLRNFIIDKQKKLLDPYAQITSNDFKCLRDLLVCRLTLFNARRGGEPSRLLLKEWEDADKGVWIADSAVQAVDDPIEKQMLGQYKIAFQSGKNINQMVPLLIPNDCLPGLKILADKNTRDDVGVHSNNIFLFPNMMSSQKHIKGWHAVENVCQMAGIKSHITATSVRHRAATLFAALDVPDSERELFYKHMGHSEPEEINRHVYQCPMAVQEVTKVGKFFENLDQLPSSTTTDVSISSGEKKSSKSPKQDKVNAVEKNSKKVASVSDVGHPQEKQISSVCRSKRKGKRVSYEGLVDDSDLDDSDKDEDYHCDEDSEEDDNIIEEHTDSSGDEITFKTQGKKSLNLQLRKKGNRVRWLERDTNTVKEYFKSYIDDASRSDRAGSLPGKAKVYRFIKNHPNILGSIDVEKKISLIKTKIFNERNKTRRIVFKQLTPMWK
ncbi:myosin heavy chain, skeletal muscle-like isoform X4 [Argopecten irradians]